MIEFKNIKKSFESFALHLSFSIDKRELVALLGPSGSGKTTVLRLLAGFETPDEGIIEIDGRDVTFVAPAKRRIGFVFQTLSLFPHLNVADNIAYGLRVQKHSKEYISDKILELLKIVNLPGYEEREIHTLSGGERQRVAIARALAPDPLILMLDEPFTAIDTPLRKELRKEILRLRERLGITIVFVTHNQEEALSISDRVIVLHEGELQQFDIPTALYKKPANRFVASFVGGTNYFYGKVISIDHRNIEIRGLKNFIISNRGQKEMARDAEVVFMVRPNDLQFTDVEETNAFTVRIVSRQFFSYFYEYNVEHQEKQFTLFDSEKRALGDYVRITFRPDSAYVMELM